MMSLRVQMRWAHHWVSPRTTAVVQRNKPFVYPKPVRLGDDKILEEAMRVRRKERETLGLEKALQQEVNDWFALWAVSSTKKSGDRGDSGAGQKQYLREVDENGEARGKGGRKAAVASVWIREGDGLSLQIKPENESKYRLMSDYFDQFQLKIAIEPLRVVQQLGKFNMRAIVAGGGLSGQAGAVSLGLARALQAWDPNLRPVLKAAGLLTRDSRVVERKKPGQKKARKKFQWVKR